jgi:hypothetical protein
MTATLRSLLVGATAAAAALLLQLPELAAAVVASIMTADARPVNIWVKVVTFTTNSAFPSESP